MSEKVRTSREFVVSVLRRLLWAGLIFSVVVFACACIFAGITDYSLHDSLYWAITTAFTIGYGDILPVTNGQQNLAMFLMVTGATMWAIVAGHVTAIIIGYREKEQMCELQAIIDHFKIKVDYSGDGS